MTEHVLVTLEKGVQILTLNRPEKKNALTPEMYGALADGLERAERDRDIRVTLITATGDAFTAGADMGDFAKAGATPVETSNTEKTPVARFLEALTAAEKPIVAAVNGLAVGIGVTMLLHCDLAYAAERATFQMPFVKLGLVPEAGSSYLLPRLIGLQRAGDLLLTGKKINAARAEALGIIAEVFPDEALVGEALARAQVLAAQAPTAVKITKALLKGHDRDLVTAQSSAEGAHFDTQLRSAEVKEAISAFFEKRPADFSKIS